MVRKKRSKRQRSSPRRSSQSRPLPPEEIQCREAELRARKDAHTELARLRAVREAAQAEIDRHRPANVHLLEWASYSDVKKYEVVYGLPVVPRAVTRPIPTRTSGGKCPDEVLVRHFEKHRPDKRLKNGRPFAMRYRVQALKHDEGIEISRPQLSKRIKEFRLTHPLPS